MQLLLLLCPYEGPRQVVDSSFRGLQLQEKGNALDKLQSLQLFGVKL